MTDPTPEHLSGNPEDENGFVYRSAVDWWIGLLVLGSPLVLIILGLFLLPSSFAGGITTIGSGLFLVLIVALFLPCDYTFKDDHLLVRCGVIRRKVPYVGITKIEPSSNPLSSPALSLRRIRIDYNGKFILISPINRDTFMEQLRSRQG